MKRIIALSAAPLLALLVLTGCAPDNHYIAPNVPSTLDLSNRTDLTAKEQDKLDSEPIAIKVGDKSLDITAAEIAEADTNDDASNLNQDHVRIALDTSNLAPHCKAAESAGPACIKVLSITSGRALTDSEKGSAPTSGSAPDEAIAGESGYIADMLPYGQSVIEFNAFESDIIHMTISMSNGASTTFNAKTGEVIKSTPGEYVAKGPVA